MEIFRTIESNALLGHSLGQVLDGLGLACGGLST